MKNMIKRFITMALVLLMLITSVPLTSINMSVLTKAEAANADFRVGDIIQYGSYPQSLVTDKSVIDVLNSKNLNWISYNYYTGSGTPSDGKMAPSDYMRYADVDIDNDGNFDYRAVVFDSYRPVQTGLVSNDKDSNQDENGYFPNTVYWFKYEPLTWIVLDPKEGLVVSEKVIDSQAFQNYVVSGGVDGLKFFGDRSKKIFANNYYFSSIRSWLNDDFYNCAFDDLHKNNINLSVVTNTGIKFPEYNSPTSEDKIYLLSIDEAKTDAYNFEPKTTSTDYAGCMGVNDSANWWTRSFGGMSLFVYRYWSPLKVYDTFYVFNVDFGIRPAMRVDLSSGTKIQYRIGKVGSNMLKFSPLMKNSVVNGSIANVSSLTGSLQLVLKSAEAKVGSKSYKVSDRYLSIPYTEGKNGIVITADKYNDYIIPSKVAESLILKTGNSGDYEETIYMSRDKENGKPYISSVFAKTAGNNESYANLVDGSTYLFSRNEKYDIIVSAGNVNGSATYYIAQDNNPKHTISNTTGVFSSASFADFDKNKTIYAWVVASNGGSDQIPLELKVDNIADNALYKALKEGKYSLGGSDGISITFPKDWVLIGGTSLDMSAFTFPAQVTYDPSQGTVRVAVGLAKYNATADPTNDEKTWTLFKDSMSGISKSAKEWEEGVFDYKVLQELKKAGVFTKSELKEIGKESKFEVGGNVILAIEFAVCDGEFVLKEGYGAIEAKIKASMDGQYAAIVYGISGGAEGSFGLTASRQVCNDNAPLSWNLKLNLTPNLKVYAGVGVQHVASADVYGILKLPFNWSFNQMQIDIALSGEVGVEAKVFIFKKNAVLLNGTLGPKYFYYGNETGSAIKSFHAPMYAGNSTYIPTYELQSRDYINDTSQWLGEAKPPAGGPLKMKASSAAANGVTFRNLQTSVYDNSNAKIITCGDTTLATWVADFNLRDAYNRTRLMYSLYDASTDTWSTPKPVYDDGFMDANPYLATDGNKIYITWQKLCKTFNRFNSTTESSILDASEIYFAEYNKTTDSFVNPTRITKDLFYDYNPVVTIYNGKPVVYYCTSTGNSMSEADGNSISRYSFNSLNIPPRKIISNLSTVYALDASGNQFVYAVDTDGDISTTNDIRTYCVDSQIDQFDKNTENSEMNFAYGKLDGKDTLFVSDGNNIYYRENNEIKTVLEENTEITGQIHVVNTDTGLSVFWTKENEIGNELFTCSYANGKWSGAVQVTSRNNEFSNISITKASNGKIIGICNESIRELDITNTYYVDGKTNLVTFTANDFTDLTALFADVDEKDLVPGQNAKLSAIIENNGNREESDFVVTITDDYGTELSTTITDSIESGKKSNIEIDYPVPDNFNGGDIKVSVDAEGDVDTSDNSATRSVDTPNLVIMKNSISVSGPFYTVDAVVNNYNFTTAKNVKFKSYFNVIEGDPFEEVILGDLSRDEYANVQISFTENDIVTDEFGQKLVYLVVEDEDGNDSQLVINLVENDTVCGHPSTEVHDRIDATCTEKGKTAGVYCLICESYASGRDEIPATGHVSDTGTVTKKATCTETGSETYKCTVCNEVIKTETVKKTAHKQVVIPAVEPTCTAAGKTEGKKCSVCGTVTKKQETVAKKAHTYKNVVTKATLTANGKITPTCSVCGAKKTATAIYMPKSFTLSATKATYTGKVIKPTVTVKDSKGNEIDAKYYTVTYANNTNVGTATVTVKFKGNYSGTKTLNFTIAPKQVTGLKSSSEATTSLKLSWTKVTGAKYYKVEQSTDGKTWTVVNAATTATSLTVSKLKAGTKYRFRVTALDSTKKIAGKASAVLKTGTLTAAPTIKLTSTKKATATVTITKVTGATKYTIYKSTDNKKWTKVGDTTKLSYNLTKLSSGKKIYVKVVAVNAYGKASAYSKVASVTVKK